MADLSGFAPSGALQPGDTLPVTQGEGVVLKNDPQNQDEPPTCCKTCCKVGQKTVVNEGYLRATLGESPVAPANGGVVLGVTDSGDALVSTPQPAQWQVTSVGVGVNAVPSYGVSQALTVTDGNLVGPYVSASGSVGPYSTGVAMDTYGNIATSSSVTEVSASLGPGAIANANVTVTVPLGSVQPTYPSVSVPPSLSGP